jgi:hypothetical protein
MLQTGESLNLGLVIDRDIEQLGAHRSPLFPDAIPAKGILTLSQAPALTGAQILIFFTASFTMARY